MVPQSSQRMSKREAKLGVQGKEEGGMDKRARKQIKKWWPNGQQANNYFTIYKLY